MQLIIIRTVYACASIGAIVAYLQLHGVADPEDIDTPPTIIENHPVASFFVLLLITQSVTALDLLIRRKRIEVVSAIYLGLLVGVLLAFLFLQALTPLIPVSHPFHNCVVMLAMLVIPYLSVSLLLQTKDDFRFLIPYVEFARELRRGHPLVVDSSSLIDGRIADVVDTGILDSQLIVPDFVLHEVQDIADSADKSRRTRGRRGLEVLHKLQDSTHTEIKMQETSAADHRGVPVDQRLVALAKTVQAGIVTSDFNLDACSKRVPCRVPAARIASTFRLERRAVTGNAADSCI